MCEYSHEGINVEREVSSSGDVVMFFSDGAIFEMPDMIVHYVGDHQYLPPKVFIEHVMGGELVDGYRLQTKGLGGGGGYGHEKKRGSMVVGYLSGPFEVGVVPEGFLQRLVKLMRTADEMGQAKWGALF